MHQHEHTNAVMSDFHRALDNTYLQWCPDCSEARLVLNSKQPPALDEGQRYTTAACVRCNRERAKLGEGACLRFSAANDMHPRAPPADLPTLTQASTLQSALCLFVRQRTVNSSELVACHRAW
jgi:hypothetical protein